MKIGIMGGTFNPIHNGHLTLAKTAKNQYLLDEIWFMPNRIPPHKEITSSEDMTKHRAEMVKLAIAPFKDFVFQPYELENTDVSYSYKTLEHFKNVYPEHEFYFIIGADSLFALEHWVKPERILKCCVILASVRDGKATSEMEEKIEYLHSRFDCDIRLLNMPNIDISSTDIRKCAKDGISLKEIVPKNVAMYITEHHLFQGEDA